MFISRRSTQQIAAATAACVLPLPPLQFSLLHLFTFQYPALRMVVAWDQLALCMLVHARTNTLLLLLLLLPQHIAAALTCLSSCSSTN